jgi:GNAT superfamily N-acetyltransferase
MTIGVIPSYRRRGIGLRGSIHILLLTCLFVATKLLYHILENAQRDPTVLEVYLHVQIRYRLASPALPH